MCLLAPGTVVAPTFGVAPAPGVGKLESCGGARNPCLKLEPSVEDRAKPVDTLAALENMPQAKLNVAAKIVSASSCASACPTSDNGSAAREHAGEVAASGGGSSAPLASVELPVSHAGA